MVYVNAEPQPSISSKLFVVECNCPSSGGFQTIVSAPINCNLLNSGPVSTTQTVTWSDGTTSVFNNTINYRYFFSYAL